MSKTNRSSFLVQILTMIC